MLQAVAEHRTVTRAAANLALSQSALSRQLLELEDSLGRALFERRHRVMIPTRAGKELIDLARGLLVELAAAEARVRGGRDEPAPLRVATECYTCYRWLPAVLRQLPERRVAITVDATRDPVAALLHGALDVAIVSAPRRDRRLVSEPAFQDEVMLLTPPQHPLARRSHVDADDLRGETLFTYDAPFEETLIARRVFLPAHARPARVHPVPFTEAILELVASGLGVAALAGWAAAPHVAARRLAQTRITRSGLKRSWHIVRRRGAPPETAALAALIRAAIRPERARVSP
jgi:LysR family transcriptional regulator for metE and metH